MYGSPNAGRLWFLLACDTILEAGFEQHGKDLGFFRFRLTEEVVSKAGVSKDEYDVRAVGHDEFVLLGLYVDDGRSVGPTQRLLLYVLAPILAKFKVKQTFGEAKFLGREMAPRVDGDVVLHLTGYLTDLLEKHQPGSTRTRRSFMPDDESVLDTRPTEEERAEAADTKFREPLGALGWAATQQAYYLLSGYVTYAQFSNGWGPAQVDGVHRMMDYVRGTGKKLGMKFNGGGDLQMKVYCDAGYANATEGRSMGGFVVHLSGGVLMAKCGIIPTPTTSTWHAEVTWECWTAQSIVYFRDLLEFAGIPQVGPTKLMVDNMAAIRFAEDVPRVNFRNRHLLTKFWYTHNLVHTDVVQLEHVASDDNAADGMSKVLGPIKLQRFLDLNNFVKL